MQFESGKFTALARIGKPVGLAGMCRIVPFGETISNSKLPLNLWVGTNRSIEQITIVSVADAGKGILKARMEGYNDRDAIDRVKNQFLYLETALLPETDEDEFYFHELKGLSVETETGEEWGTVVDVFNFPTTDAVEIKRKNGKKVLFPFRRETVAAVLLEDKKIIVDSELLEELA